MDANLEQVQPPRYADGSRVLGSDGLTIGEVVASYREHLIVECGYFFPTNVYIPFSSVAEAGGGDIVLSLGRRDALRQGWDRPPADPIAPPAATLPAPPPDPTFPSQAAMDLPRRPEPLAQQPVATAAPVSTPEPPPATPEPPPELAVAASDTQEPNVPADEPVAMESIPETPSTDQYGAPVGVDLPPAPAAPTLAMPDAPDVPAVEAELASDSVDTVAAEDQPKPDDPGDQKASADVHVPAAASVAPSVGIPGRRLTDSELWSLLEPKEGGPAEGDLPDEAVEDSAAVKPEQKE